MSINRSPVVIGDVPRIYVLNLFGGKVPDAPQTLSGVCEEGGCGRTPARIDGRRISEKCRRMVALKAMRNGESRIKGDERILGQGDFVETVLKTAQENLDRNPLVA
jgi:hypothetical protein